MLSLIEVGKPFAPLVGMGEGVVFEASDEGYTLAYCFNRPTQKELGQMAAGVPFEIRFAVLDGVIWILSKCGSNEWTDAPYAPQLTKSATIIHPVDGQGTALTLMMVDSPEGVVRTLRLIGLGSDFSRKLATAIGEVGAMPFDRAAYDRKLASTMSKYSTKDMVAMAQARWKLRAGDE